METYEAEWGRMLEIIVPSTMESFFEESARYK